MPRKRQPQGPLSAGVFTRSTDRGLCIPSIAYPGSGGVQMEYSRRFYKRTLLGDGHDGILAPPVPPIPSEISRHVFLVVVHVVAAQCQILDSDRSAGVTGSITCASTYQNSIVTVPLCYSPSFLRVGTAIKSTRCVS